MAFKLPENDHRSQRTPKFLLLWVKPCQSLPCKWFPAPILNTDDNAEANTVPNAASEWKKDEQGRRLLSVISQIGEILLASEAQKHSYQTVVVDVGDVIEMINCRLRRIDCPESPLKSLSEIPYRKECRLFQSAITEMVIDLKALPMNVIYISQIKYLNIAIVATLQRQTKSKG